MNDPCELDIESAALALRRGGTVIYPTETFYALGACVLKTKGLKAVCEIKGRPSRKPLPVIIGELEQLWDVASPSMACGETYADFSRLIENFWPGPLSVLVPGREDLPPWLKAPDGTVSLRLSPHPLARALCKAADSPLCATSANLSGSAPAAKPQDIDPELLKQTAGLLSAKPWPAGGRASTVVAISGPKLLRIVRDGLIERDLLKQSGFEIESTGRGKIS